MKTTLTEVAIDFAGIPMTVTGVFSPAESCIMYDNDMSGMPASNAEFDIDSIQINGQEVNDLLNDEQYDSIVELCINSLENQL